MKRTLIAATSALALVVPAFAGFTHGSRPKTPEAAEQLEPRVPSTGPTGSPQDDMGRFVSAVLGSTELQWKQIFAKDGKIYRPPVLVLDRGVTQRRRCAAGHSSCSLQLRRRAAGKRGNDSDVSLRYASDPQGISSSQQMRLGYSKGTSIQIAAFRFLL